MLTLATWNVRHSTSAAGIVATVTDLIGRHELDVICLQELTPLSLAPPRASVHRALRRATGWHTLLAVHPRPYPGWLEGVAILTRLPVVRHRRIWLSSNRRYVQTVVRDPELGEVCIGGIHLSSPGRRRHELRRALAAAPEHGYVLAGDFNLRLHDPILSEALSGYASDGLPGVDHIYVTPDLRLVQSHVERTSASDHDAVVGLIAAGAPAGR
jgi:endonuclease/exonuclease/phosphatase family metal-dependent hydrolase